MNRGWQTVILVRLTRWHALQLSDHYQTNSIIQFYQLLCKLGMAKVKKGDQNVESQNRVMKSVEEQHHTKINLHSDNKLVTVGRLYQSAVKHRKPTFQSTAETVEASCSREAASGRKWPHLYVELVVNNVSVAWNLLGSQSFLFIYLLTVAQANVLWWCSSSTYQIDKNERNDWQRRMGNKSPSQREVCWEGLAFLFSVQLVS